MSERGGNVTAESLIQRARELGIELWSEGNSLRFKAPKGALTAEIRDALKEHRAAIVQTLQTEAQARVEDLELADNQRGMWFLQFHDPESFAYNIRFAVRIHSRFDYSCLEDALQLVADRNDSLRSSYPEVDGEPKRRVYGRLPVPVFHHQVQNLDEPACRELLNKHHAEPFDIAQGSLLRLHVYHLNDDETLVQLLAHHLVVDGTGIFMLVEQWFACFEALRNKQKIPPPPEAASFSEFVDWQREALEKSDDAREFWARELSPFPPKLDLPTDVPRAEKRTVDGAGKWVRMPREVVEQVQVLGKELGVTRFAVYLGFWFAFLHRLTGQSDFSVGTPVIGRPAARFAQTVGDLINVLPLRQRDFGGMSLRELVQALSEKTLAAFSHQDYPLPKMVEQSQTHDNLGQPPFQTTFALQDFGRGSALQVLMNGKTREAQEYRGLQMSPFVGDQMLGQFQLSLDVWPDENGAGLSWRYDRAVHSDRCIEAWADDFQALVVNLLAEPDVPIATLPAVSSDWEVKRLGSVSPDTIVADGSTSFIDDFRAVAQSSPESVALSSGDAALSFAELDKQSDAVARALLASGVRSGALVGICTERNVGLLLSALGVLKTGAAYLPLDPAFPDARLNYMLSDSGTKVLICDRAFQGVFSDPTARYVTLDELLAQGEKLDASLPELVDPDARAYVIYTSGSTGKPKGVEVSHANATNFLRSMATRPGLGDSDSLLAVTTLSFDISVLELFLPLITGANVVVANREEASDPALLSGLLTAFEISHMQATPSQWRLLLDSGWKGNSALTVLCGGEAFPPDLANALIACTKSVWNMYGPTETTVWSSCTELFADEPVHIGAPIANTQLYVLNDALQLQAANVAGELWIGGDGVTLGYLKRPELTAQRFIENPFRPGERMYRTGDSARYTLDGSLQHLGRLDDQIKIRGFRIELGEIESRIAEFDGIAMAAVNVWEPAPGDARLAAYYTQTLPVDTQALSEYLSANLPAYMVPQYFVQLDVIPLTPNAKIDRKSLPNPQDHGPAQSSEPPVGDTEESLAELWADILGTTRLSRSDSFFERGGHSLLAGKVLARIPERFGVSISLRELFAAPVLSELARLIEAKASTGLKGVNIAPADRSKALPITAAQRRLWFLDQLESNSTAYLMPSAVHLHGSLDASALASSLSRLVQRHEVLRSAFDAEDGEPVLRIDSGDSFALNQIDLREKTPEHKANRLAELISENSENPISLAAGLLLRASLVRLADQHYVLLMAFHHIAFDYWSAAVFTQELNQLYGQFVNSQDGQLPALECQFVDFAAWQAQRLDEQEMSRLLGFWRKELGADLAPLDLPGAAVRTANSQVRANMCRQPVAAATYDKLRALAAAESVTVSTAVLSVFQVWLHRLTGAERLRVGSPVAGRPRREFESLVGFFINTVVLAADFSEDNSFSEVLRSTHETSLRAMEHQELPFERLVQAMEPARNLQRTPIFQVFFNHIGIEAPELELPGVQSELDAAAELESKFDLTLYVFEQRGSLELVFAYDAALFSAELMHDYLQQLYTLLQALIERPDSRIAGHSLARAKHLPNPAQTLTSRLPSRSLCFPELARFGDRPAIVTSEKTWTYLELDRAANAIAQCLLGSGRRKGDVVCILAERSAWLPISLLGVLRAGAAFCVLDKRYPDSWLQECLTQANAMATIVIGDDESAVISDLSPVLNLPEDYSKFADVDASTLPEMDADDLAYVAFTSGTTGRAQALAGNHGPVSHFLHWQQQTFSLSESDRFTLLSGLAHDPLLRDVFAPLYCGASVFVPDAAEVSEPETLLSRLEEYQISVAHLTPAMGSMMCSAAGNHSLDSLRWAFFSGDRLTPDVCERLQSLAPDTHCVNFYGATETPQAMSAYTYEPGRAYGLSVPVGQGIDGVELLIVNSNGQLAAVGESGEILIRTQHLCRGYLNDPENARFVPNPFGNDPQDRVYRSGDIGYYLADGNVQVVGRADRQLKIRGFRVEADFVRKCLLRVAAMSEAAVVGRTSADGQTILGAYCVSDDELDFEQIRASLLRELPDYAVPSQFGQLERLPMTANGKLDEAALPAIEEIARRSFEQATSPLEEYVAGVFSSLLNVDSVGRHDSFFALGGHSLLGAQLVARINQKQQCELPLRALFEGPSPAQLASSIENLGVQRRRADVPPLVAMEHDGDCPISLAQERLWYLQQMHPGSGAFNLSGALRLKGALDLKALNVAYAQVVTRQEALKTRITSRNGWPVQDLFPSDVLKLGYHDFRDEASRLNEVLRANSARGFDFERDALVRADLYQLADDESVLQFVCHHIVADAWSMGVLMSELTEAYNAAVERRDARLPELKVSYRDYTVWQRSTLQDKVREEALDYWRQTLRGASMALDLPTDRPRPAEFDHTGARHSFEIPAADAQAFKQLLGKTEATLFMGLMALYQVLLSRYSGQEDIIVGTPVANRGLTELEGLFGFFVNTLVLRGTLSAELGFSDFLDQIRNRSIDAFAHQSLPFEVLVEDLQPKRDLSRNPVFQVMFVLQNMAMPSMDLIGVDVEAVDAQRTTAQVDLTMFAWESDGAITVTFEYATALFDVSTIQRMETHFLQLLKRVVANPEEPLQSLSILTAIEAGQLLEDVNNTQRTGYEQATLIARFEQQVQTRGSEIALVFEKQQVSYSELDKRANVIANALLEVGVAGQDLVGLCLDRGVDMVAAALAIMKTGAAYVPLDPSFPADRIRYMLSDSESKVVVTDSQQLSTLLADCELPALNIDELESSETATFAQRSRLSERAYVIYTSGSTGLPKGVEIEHRALANFLTSMAREPGVTSQDRLYAVTTLSFDISILEIFLPLSVGARLILASKEASTDGRRIVEELADNQVTLMQATPSTWRVLLDAGWQGGEHFRVLCGGEPFPADLAEDLLPRVAQVWNMFGPTETTIWSSCARLTAGEAIHIGLPIDNTQFYVLNDQMSPQPVGVPGELWIGGAGVARSYLNRPDLSAERFVGNPFAKGRIYRTGDQARWTDEGRLEHMGRLDGQVKIRGYRIELGEIEYRLSQSHAVAECAVVVQEPRPGDQRLVAFYVPDARNQATATELRKLLKADLPAYMIPQHFMEIEALPQTPNAKIDRKALLEYTGHRDNARDFVAPDTAQEIAVASLWAEMLGVEKVGAHDNFFDIGGHSLLAIRVRAAMEEKLGLSVTLQSLTSDSLAQIASQLHESKPLTKKSKGLGSLIAKLRGHS